MTSTRTTPLSSIASVIMGQSPPGNSYNNSGIGVPLVNGPSEFDGRWLTQIKWTTMPTKLCAKGDVVVCVRATIGRTALADGEYCMGRGVAAIRAYPGKSDSEFIFQLVQYLQDKLLQLSNGSTFPNIDRKTISNVSVPNLNLDEQYKITEILKTWDESIKWFKDLKSIKKRQLAGLIQRLLGRSSTLHKHWPVKPLSAISTRIRRQGSGNSHPVMTISAKSGFLIQSEKYARDMAGRSVERYTLLCKGEFAYNKGNSLTAPYGCIYPLECPTALVPFVYHCFALMPDLNHEFYTHYFAAGMLNHQLSRLINSSVRHNGLLNLNSNDFFNCKVSIPPANEQKRVARVLTAAKNEITLIDNQINALTLQKRGLMQHLFADKQ